jgi:hypothetical protein
VTAGLPTLPFRCTIRRGRTPCSGGRLDGTRIDRFYDGLKGTISCACGHDQGGGDMATYRVIYGGGNRSKAILHVQEAHVQSVEEFDA